MTLPETAPTRSHPFVQRRRAFFCLLAAAWLFSLGWSSPASAGEWEPVAPGISYREFVLDGPTHVFVARMDIDATQAVLESSLATGSLAQGLETVSEMARRYDQTLSAWGGTWGPRSRVVVAVNGSSYFPDTGVPYGGFIHDGWYVKRFGDSAGTSGLAWGSDRQATIGGCVTNPEEANVVTNLETGEQMEILAVNDPVHRKGLLLFTPQYDGWTPEGLAKAEVVLEVSRPVGVVPLPGGAHAVVVEVRDGKGHTPILFNQVVLAARGKTALGFALALNPGDEVSISQEINDRGDNCRSAPRLDWSYVYAAIGGGFGFLRGGEIRHGDEYGATTHVPRTAFCVNDVHVDFVVVDGREEGYSAGMSLDEVAAFCRDELDDTDGINQDGGGSSAMWVHGRIVNHPSDGSERAVANGMMMTVLEPPARSNRFAPGFRVLVQRSAEVRLGPGFNYPVLSSLRVGTLAELLPTSPELQGIFATGMFWWKVNYDGQAGWVPEASLVTQPQALAVFQMPTFPVVFP
jgi:hypothetical protein